jgi:hypothetical protein
VERLGVELRHPVPRAHELWSRAPPAAGSQGPAELRDRTAGRRLPTAWLPLPERNRLGDKKIAGLSAHHTAVGRAGSAGTTVRRQSIASSNSASWAGSGSGRRPRSAARRTGRAPTLWRTGTAPSRPSTGSSSNRRACCGSRTDGPRTGPTPAPRRPWHRDRRSRSAR